MADNNGNGNKPNANANKAKANANKAKANANKEKANANKANPTHSIFGGLFSTSGKGAGAGNGTVAGTGNGTVAGTGNGTVAGNGNGTVAGTGNNNGNSNGNGNGNNNGNNGNNNGNNGNNNGNNAAAKTRKQRGGARGKTMRLPGMRNVLRVTGKTVRKLRNVGVYSLKTVGRGVFAVTGLLGKTTKALTRSFRGKSGKRRTQKQNRH